MTNSPSLDSENVPTPAYTATLGGSRAVAPIVERLLTYRQAGELLGVTERTVWTLVDQGQLPSVRFGRSVRIEPADLRKFIEQSKQCGSEVGDDH